MTQAQEMVTPLAANPVADEDRLSFLPAFFGRAFLRGESLVYAWMRRLSEDYTGGYWDFYMLTNGGFYLAPARDKQMRVMVAGNYFDSDMSADAAGIVATLFALCQLASELAGTELGDTMSDRYHLLLDFARDHAESGLIFRAID